MSARFLKHLTSAAVLLAASTGYTLAAGAGNWGYEGETGPANWHQLKPEWQECKGKNQSPIDIRNRVAGALTPIVFNYRTGSTEIVNKGKTLQVNFEPGSEISLDGRSFTLLQYHIHLPSENLISGERFPLEIHLVHADRDSNLAVVALMFEQGRPHAGIEAAFSKLPATGEKLPLPALSAAELLPQNTDYYRFNGSLTTPPCTEGVRWLVMKQPLQASAEQLSALKALIPQGNARPVQPVNARLIVE